MPTALNGRVRAFLRRVPGLSPAYWRGRDWLAVRRGTATIDYQSAPVRLRVTTRAIVRRRLAPCAKEPWTVGWLEQNVRPEDVVYDVGANVGAYALIAATLAGGRARVIALEPAAANYDALSANILLNGVADRVTALPLALADSTRLVVLVGGELEAGETHSLGNAWTPGSASVLAFALDELIETFALPSPTLIKVDVDGAEGMVLAGAARTLASPELRSVIVEVDASQTDDVSGAMDHAGLRLSERFDRRFGKPLDGIWYGIFSRAGL